MSSVYFVYSRRILKRQIDITIKPPITCRSQSANRVLSLLGSKNYIFFTVVSYFLATHSAEAQQVVSYSIDRFNLTVPIRQGQVYPNTLIPLSSLNANAIGQSISTGPASVALGASSTEYYDLGTSNLSYDIGAVATGTRSIAIGASQGGSATIYDTYCIITTCTDQVRSGTATLISGATATDSIAIGTAASASQVNAIAIGGGAISGVANGVSIGSGSIVGPVNIGAYTINSGTIAGINSNGGAVSFGASGSERQVQNVGAGVVSTTSTDAVNGSQLYAVGAQVNTNTANILTNSNSINSLTATQNTTNTNLASLGTSTATALGGGSTYTAGTGVTVPVYTLGGNSYTGIQNALTAAYQATSGSQPYFNANSSLSNSVASGSNSTAIGPSSTASGTDSVAAGINANATAISSSAIGANTSATFANSTAIGSGATTTAANQIMLGASSTIYSMRGITSAASTSSQVGTTYFTTTDANGNLATSTYGAQDIGNMQTQTATNTANIATNTASINTLNTTVASQGTQINTNTANIATSGQSTANALGGGSTYTASGGVTAPTYNVRGVSYSNVGSAIGAINSQMGNYDNSIANLTNSVGILGAGLASTNQRLEGLERKAMQGVAIAGAAVAAPMPSAPGKTRIKMNNSFYRGYAATSVSISHRLPTTIPAALTAGVSVGYRNSAMVTGGAEVEF